MPVSVSVGTLTESSTDGLMSYSLILASGSACFYDVPAGESLAHVGAELFVGPLSKLAVGTYAVPHDVPVGARLPSDAAGYPAAVWSSSGSFSITAVDARSITGSVDVSFGSAGNVSGSFYAPVCAPPDAG